MWLCFIGTHVLRQARQLEVSSYSCFSLPQGKTSICLIYKRADLFFFTLPNIHADYRSFALQSAEALHQKDKCQLCCLKLSILQHNLQEVITLYCIYSVDFLHEFPIPSRHVKFLNPSFCMVF